MYAGSSVFGHAFDNVTDNVTRYELIIRNPTIFFSTVCSL